MMKKYLFTFLILILGTSLQAQNWDIDLLRSINKKQSPGKTALFKLSSNSAYVVPIAYPLITFTVGKIKKDNALLKQSLYSALSLATVGILTFSVKQIVKRPRPYVTYPDLIVDKPEITYSFPSGHTSIAFCTATSISLYYNKWYVTVPAFAWAAMVSTSRMYLGKHYPTDIIGGMLLGTAIPLLFHFWKPLNHFIDRTGKAIFKY